MHPAPQREPLAAGVGDGVAEPRVAQELRVGLGEVVAAVGLQGAHGFPSRAGCSPWAPRGWGGCSSSNCLEGTSHKAVVELPRSCELAVGAGE